MQPLPLRLLLLEDSQSEADSIVLELKRAGYAPSVTRVTTEDSFRLALRNATWDLLLADYDLPGFSGIEALRVYAENALDTPFFLLSSTLGEERVVEAMRAGAHDYLLKDSLSRLGPAIQRELYEAELRRKRSEDVRRLIASERRFTSIFQSSPVAIVVASLSDGLIYDVNPAALALFHTTRSALIGRAAASIGAWPSAEERLRLGADGPDGAGRNQTFEREVLAEHGETLTVLASFSAIEIEQAPRLLVTLQDISHRKQSERALRESEERFRLLVENSNDLIAELASDGTILYASPNYALITGHQPSALVGRDLFEFVHAEDVAELALRFERSPAAGTFRLRFADGSYHWFECSSNAFRLSDESERSVLVSRDVSERVEAERARTELEDQLRKAQRLEALGTLAGGIAHDFNNILAAIIAYTEMAGEDADNPVAVREYVAELQHASRRATDLVKQILSFSRQQKHFREPILLVSVLNEALKLLRSTLPASIEIVANVMDDEQIVLADPSQVHQVLMNLCTNAAHAIGDAKGRITVTLESLEVDATSARARRDLRPGRYARLRVADTGHGMDAATLERAFEPFFTTKAPGEGTGLGLAVVHGIMKNHEGSIRVTSEPGVGSEFELCFPEHDAPDSRALPAHESEQHGKGEHVLFVDDEQPICRGVGLMLERLGYQVTTFTNPEAALAFFADEPERVDVVLTDLSMPNMNGVELARQLLALRPGLPVLLLSGFSGKWTSERVAAAGLRGVVAKPLSAQALASALRRAVEPKRLAS